MLCGAPGHSQTPFGLGGVQCISRLLSTVSVGRIAKEHSETLQTLDTGHWTTGSSTIWNWDTLIRSSWILQSTIRGIGKKAQGGKRPGMRRAACCVHHAELTRPRDVRLGWSCLSACQVRPPLGTDADPG